MDFLRSFLANRPSKSQLKKKGILKERVFGCDLGELLHRTGEDGETFISCKRIAVAFTSCLRAIVAVCSEPSFIGINCLVSMKMQLA